MDSLPELADYAQAGVTGVDASNVAAINSALNSDSVDGAAVDTAPEIQALVNAYKAVLSAADGQNDDDRKPTSAEYSRLGVTGINTAQAESLLGDVIDIKGAVDVNTVDKLQKLADAVAATLAAAAGASGASGPSGPSGPSAEQLQLLGLSGLTAANLAPLQKAIQDSADDGTGVDTLAELQALLSQVQAKLPAITATGLNAITEAALNNTATETKPSLSDYEGASDASAPGVTGVSGVNAANLAAINSALNTELVGKDQVDTLAEVQQLVNAYNKVLAAADGKDDNDAKPSQADYALLGITGVGNAQKESLLGDVLDVKVASEVDSARELQELANAVAAVIAAPAPNAPAPTIEQLKALGLSGLNPANIAAVQAAIKTTAPDGSGVDTLPELQALVNAVNQAFDAISDAAQANNATETSPRLADYAQAGVTGVDASNLAAINSALNSDSVDGAAVDTAPEIQALVNAYKAVLSAADGQNDDDRKPTSAEYARLGVTGISTAQAESLLGDVIDIKGAVDVNTVDKLQKLADAVAATLAAAAGASGPSAEQLQLLGLSGLTGANLAPLQKAIQDSADDGSCVQTRVLTRSKNCKRWLLQRKKCWPMRS